MIFVNVKKEINMLSELLRYYDYHYYVTAEPLISDRLYDYLLKHLITLEENNPELIKPDSPSQVVGGGF